MRCPFCSAEETQVKDSRATDDNQAIRRRRLCPTCSSRFTTFERVQLCDLIVIKNDGRKERFDREKIARSIYNAARKRPIPTEKQELIVNSLVRKLETMGETEIPSRTIGEISMETLKDLDSVAYIRFASVYREFAEVTDFQKFIGTIDEPIVAEEKEE